MVRARRGRIVNISSLAGVKMMQAPVHYSAAKAALQGLHRGAGQGDRPLRHHGELRSRPASSRRASARTCPRRACEEYLRNCALGRVGTFAEVAEVVAFVASDRNSYMNGATIVLDGGV